jgi:FkbH-like protein
MAAIPTLLEIEQLLARDPDGHAAPMQICVLRTVTVEPIEPYLRYFARAANLNPTVRFGAFDGLAQEAIGGAPGLLNADLDAILVFAPLETLSPSISRDFVNLDTEARTREVIRLKEYFEAVIQGIRRQTDAPILWHALETPVSPLYGILDAQQPHGQTATVRELNEALQAALVKGSAAYLIDTDNCRARLGAPAFYDERYWHIAKAPYSRQALAMIAAEDFKYLRALRGMAKKCLVLDCDNTLWGGIIGEDGLSGLQLGETYPGSAFVAFQHQVLSLHRRGVILALCSKNNEADVWEVFDRHPSMVLRREHIAAARINWDDKATNIKDLAQILNIGLDSMVLADDNSFEINLVRAALPSVEVLQLPNARPVGYASLLASSGLFDILTVTDEDRQRGAMYSSEAARRQAAGTFASLDEYCRSLSMRLEIGFSDELTIGRIAQLTQKTNQFNLTTRRFNESEIAKFSSSIEHDVLWVRLSDQFGDYGIVGAAILHHIDRRVEIGTFLLSCRALGRQVEQAFLREVLAIAHAKGARVATGYYLPTAKNAQVASFFPLNGFSEIEAPSDDGGRTFECLLEAPSLRDSGWFAEIKRPLVGQS